MDYFSLTRPPQARLVSMNSELVAQSRETRKAQRFRKNVCMLICSKKIHYLQSTFPDKITYKMHIHLNILGSNMEDWIGGKINSANIITPNYNTTW